MESDSIFFIINNNNNYYYYLNFYLCLICNLKNQTIPISYDN